MQKAVKFWDRVSSPASPNPGGTSRKIIEATTPYLQKQDQVLDLGCGSGGITNALAPKVESMLGLDISPKALEYARIQAKEKGLTNIQYSATNLFDIGLSPNSYTIIMAFNVLPYVEDLGNTLQRIHQLLKPGGIFISSTVCLRDKRNIMRPFIRILSTLTLLPPTQFFSSVELETVLKKNSFQIEKSYSLTELPERLIVTRRN